MARIGMNVPWDGSQDLGQLYHDHHVRAIRIVARREHDLRDYFLVAMNAYGMKITLVFDRTSIEQFDSAEEAVTHYRDLYGDMVHLWQVGNEPDLVSDSSWTMTQQELETLLDITRRVMPNATLAIALASGQPSWLDDLDLTEVDVIGFNPYVKDAPNPDDQEDLPDVTVLMTGYAAYGKPLCIMEWGWWGDELRGAWEVADMLDWASETTNIFAYHHFCIGDWMVPPFGLYRADGSPKPALLAFVLNSEAAVDVSYPVHWSQPVVPPIGKRYVGMEAALYDLWTAVRDDLPYNEEFGIIKYWRDHWKTLGSPVGHERYADDGRIYQAFTRGIVEWSPDGPRTV